MSDLVLFENNNSLPTVRRKSRLADTIFTGSSLRQIKTNTNGTFKRIVGGEQIGRSVPHQLNVIVVDQAPEVGRSYYAEAYDKDAQAKAPDCWSNDGRTPDAGATNKQASSCKSCSMNIAGSGARGKGKACRFRRSLAVMVEGDDSGEVYQLGVAAMSLFGDPVGNNFPYEAYCRYLKANGEGPDSVVTKVMYDTDADTLTLKFRAVRHLTQEESDLVDIAVVNPDLTRYTLIATASNRPAGAQEEKAAPKVQLEAKASAKPKNVFADEDDDAGEPEIMKSKRSTNKVEAAPTAKPKITSVMDTWEAADKSADDGDE